MKKIFSAILLISLILNSCGKDVKPSEKTVIEPKQVKTELVKKDYFSERVKLIGKAAPFMETPVSPLVAGTIKTINVEVGQKIKAGQVLATIDLGNSTFSTSYNNANIAYNNSLNSFSLTEESIKKDLESAMIQLENAKTSRDNTYTTTEEQLQLAQNQLENIKTSHKNTITTTSESLKNSKLALENAKTNLSNFKKTSQETMNGLYENLKVSLSTTLVTIDSSLTQADTILGITDKNKGLNDSYEVYLGAKDSKTKVISENSFRETKSQFDNLSSSTYGSDPQSLDAKTARTMDLLNKDSDLYDKMIVMINNSISSSNFPQTQLDAINVNLSKTQSSILQSQSQLTTLKNSISSAKTGNEANLVSLENAINIAQAQLDNIIAGNSSQIDSVSGNEELTQTQYENTIATVNSARDSVDNALRIAQATYDSTKAKLDSQRIQIKSQIDNAKGGKEIAGINLNNTSIISPIDGVVTSKNIEVGTSVSPQAVAFTVSNNKSLKIKLDVSSENMAHFHQNDNMEIKKNDKNYTGIVLPISPSPDSASHLYKIDLLLNGTSDGIAIGDFVDVYLKKESKDEKIISIPLSAFIAFGEGKYGVFTVGKDNIAKLNYVALGRKNSSNVEVISGLEEGSRYVTQGALNLSDGDTVNEAK